ncbi:MAG: gliding motility-associated C-terminal domain-containing protein [Crocinitomicaceae bacterium]|nr:gliding motility-associated C-terminal domain-containing protein [Flavobacteriales bacterium]NQZ36693.1 gliding motility-associated C-terminal domain-containing protein [Crocinitomicaceae bacterium]
MKTNLPRNFVPHCLTLLLFISALNTSIAQVDTLFWFAAPEVAASQGDSPIQLRFMTYENPATVTISLPANGVFTPITLTIPANSTNSVDLTSFLAIIESPAGNVVANNGLKIESTERIGAFYELGAIANKELFSLKGVKALGTNFYTPFQNHWDNATTTPGSFSSIDIVASEDNTTVLITPRTAITGHAQDVTFSIILNEGETYSARDMNTTGSTSLSGSIVSSDKPIALTLFSGALTEGSCSNSMGDQITNASFTGRDFVINKGTSSFDRVYILATQNGTGITINNTTTTTTLINWGETYEIDLNDPQTYIQTTKPVYVWHASGYGCELSGAQVPHLSCAGTYSTAFTRTSSDSLGLMLYTRSGFENQFAINGNATLITAPQFVNVPGTSGNYKMAAIYFSTGDIAVGSYNEVTNAGDIFGLGMIQGNSGSGAGYAYLSEFESYPFTTVGNDTTICANRTLPLDGLIGGGDITGDWSTSGFGSYALPSSTLANEYLPSPLDTLISPIQLILTSTGACPVRKDTIILTVTPAPIVTASADQTLCENNSTLQLAGGVSGGATTGTWSTLGSGTFSPDPNTLNAEYIPSIVDLANGFVDLVLTSTGVGNCEAETDTMQVTFTGPPIVDAGADTISVCQNAPNVSLIGSVTGSTTTGKWTTSGGGLFLPNNLNLTADYQPSPTDVTSGSIMLYLESTGNGSCLPEYDSIVVLFTPPPSVEAGTNFLVCANDASVDLNGIISGQTTTGIWSGGTGVYSGGDTDLTSNYTPTAAEILTGNVFLTLTSTNNGGCIAETDVVQIAFVTPPFANFNFTETCLYDGSDFTDFSLPGFGTLTSWEWNFGDTQTSIDQNTSHSYATAGTYPVQLIVTSSVGCTDSITQNVNSFEVPVADYTVSSDCPNNQIIVDFTDNSTTTNDALNYWFYDFGGAGSIATENATQLFSVNGDYTITHIVGTVNGCFDTTIQTLNVPEFPIADFSYNTNNGLNIGAVFNFINTSSNGSTYYWEFGDNGNSTDENPMNTYFSNGTYVITQYVYGSLGCVDSTSQTIIINTVTNEITTLIPNAISPNGDGKNDIWKLEFINLLYPNARVEVYNQWGQQIYQSKGYNYPWDGRYNDELLPDGTYYYVIDINDAGNAADIFKGTVLILKTKK